MITQVGNVRDFQNSFKFDNPYKIEVECCLVDTNEKLDERWINESYPNTNSVNTQRLWCS